MNTAIQQQINQKIRQLPYSHQLAFGVILAERFLPNYFAFYFTEQWGNPMVLLNGIDLLKNIIRENQFDPAELELIDSLIEEATPDMEEFLGNYLASMALDISSMLYECFLFVKNRQPKHIEVCSQISYESLKMYIQKRDDLGYNWTISELNDYYSKDTIMKGEVAWQLNILEELLANNKITNKLYIEKTIEAPNLRLIAA